MANISFYSNNFGGTELDLIHHNDGSGIGFFGDSIGLSVPITTYQNSTYTTNSNGTSTDGIKLSNTKFASTSGCFHNNSATETDLRAMPNYWGSFKCQVYPRRTSCYTKRPVENFQQI